MAYTLADAKELSQSKLTRFVIDEFRKSPLLEAMTFDDCVKPQGGNSLAYVYNRVTTLPTASGRALGSEYTPQEAKTTSFTVNLQPFGGSFSLDRILIDNEKQVVTNLIQWQMEQKIKATRALAADWFVNGDNTADATAFDGLDKAITGSTTENKLATNLDMSSVAAIDSNWKTFLYYIRQTIKRLDGSPTLMIVNADMFAAFQTVADYSTQFTATKDALGSEIVKYGNTVIMNAGDKPGTSDPIIDINSDGTSDIFFTRVGLDGVHGVTPSGQKVPKTYVPNMSLPGAVKIGEVEMIMSMAVKATRSAGVLRGIQIGASA